VSRPRSPRTAPTSWRQVPISMKLEKAAEVVGVSRVTLWREVTEGRLRALRFGASQKAIRITQDDLRAFLAGEPQGPRDENGVLLRVCPGGIEDVA
jgi:excisionase family DNA binding protein